MMVHQANVRTVTVGGIPRSGPMQAASGTRGARAYSGDELDYDILWAQSTNVNNASANASLPRLDDGYRDSGVFQLFTGVNLRDQVRRDDPDPLQFRYQAADCRLYYTLANVYNFTQLWHDAAAAMWTDNSLCVEGSLGYAEHGNATNLPPPKPESLASNVKSNGTGSGLEGDSVNLQAGRPRTGRLWPPQQCTSNKDCTGGGSCQPCSVKCPSSSASAPDVYVPANFCVQTCVTGNRDPCSSDPRFWCD